MIMEEWKDIAGYGGDYQVSDHGVVKSLKGIKERLLRPKSHPFGYPMISLCKNGHRNDYCIHRLVLETFVGQPPENMECCHADGDPKNNCLSNLRWGTRKENCFDTIKHNKTTRGERSHTSKLTEIDVHFIRYWLKKGYSKEIIGKTFGVTPSNICHIASGKSWSWLGQ